MVDLVPSSYAPIGSPAFRQDPYPTYAYLRSLGPIHREPDAPIWHVVGYQAVQAALRHPHLASDRLKWMLSGEERRAYPVLARILPDMMVFADPPRHTLLRGLVAKAFTPRIVNGLRPRIEAIVNALLARAISRGTFDVIADLAVPLPLMVIGELLGVPQGDRERLKAWSDDFAVFAGGPTDDEGVARADRAIRDFTAYFTGVVAQWRQRPGDNLISALIATEEQGERLSHDELMATSILLLIAGHETTTNLIGNGLLVLLRCPEQAQRLRREPALIALAVEELLRYDSPVQMTTRLAIDDLTLGAAAIGKGAMVKLWLGAANRDAEQFAEPDRLDIARTENRHLSFGYGVHFCVGAALARLEGQVALATLIETFPNLQHADEPLEYHGTQVFRALKRLPVMV